MRRVKRTALSVRPKAPYIEWANGLEVGGVKIGSEFMPETTIYLVEDTAGLMLTLETLLEPYYEALWEEELGDWHRVEEAWPIQRDLTTFMAWFEVEVHSMVLDLGGRWLRTERYVRY
jgi:hypothetical protein